MKTTLKAPYNFVPLNKKVYIPDWGDKISHDIPFSDGEDGVITLTFTNTTPLFISDGKEQPHSCHIETPEGKLFFLPGSSIKGMLRSVAEILSFAKMQPYNKDYFGYREFIDNEYKAQMNNAQAGWLTYKNGEFQIEEYEKEKILIEDIPQEIAYKKNNSLKDNLRNIKNKKGEFYPTLRNGRLVYSGPIINKLHEHLFTKKTGDTFIVNEYVINRFLSAYKQSPHYELIIQNQLEKGNAIPVFFTTNNDQVEYIGLSRNFRLPFAKGVEDGIHQTSSDNSHAGYDMCECIFGYTQEKNALKGRIQIGHAFAQEPSCVSELPSMKCVLGSPKASFYPLYLRQTEGNASYKKYNNTSIEIAGRKRYRIHANNCSITIPQGNGNEKNTKTLTPLKPGVKFEVSIHLHNLRPSEIGLILSAITFHNNLDKCSHNIGMAKGFGYGKLRTENIKLHGLTHDMFYYMESFEEQMNHFTYKCGLVPWHEQESILQLMSIAQDHSNAEELEYLKLKEHSKIKETRTEILHENPFELTPIKNVILKKVMEIKQEMFAKELDTFYEVIKSKIEKTNNIEEMHQLIEDCRKFEKDHAEFKTNEVESLINEIEKHKLAWEYKAFINNTKSRLNKKNLNLNEVKALLAECDGFSNRLGNTEYNEINEIKEELNKWKEQIWISTGLSLLNELDNKREFKTNEFNKINNLVSQWLKKTKKKTVPQEEIGELETALIRAYKEEERKNASKQNPTKFKESWNTLNSKVWKSLRPYVDEKSINRLFNAINSK